MADESERRRLVGDFIDIFPVEEAIAQAYLGRNHWNFETAVRDYLITQDMAEGDSTNEHLHPVREVAAVDNNSFVQNVFGSPLVRILWSFLYIPFRYVMSFMSDIVTTLWSIFVLPFQGTTNGLADVEAFAEKFNNTYSNRHPTFYHGTYSSALNDAKRELRYLVVYLHSSYHQDSDRFCRSVICHPDFINFVEGIGLFFAVDVASGEGYRVSAVLMDSSYPFLALICYRDRRMSVVFRQEGYCEVYELIPRLSRAVNVNDHYLNLAREERQNTEMNQMLRQQQEAAYEEALQRDRESEQRVMDEVKKKQEEEAKEKAARDKEEEEKRTLMDMRQQCAAALPVEPISKDAIRIRLKFPSGDTFERHFLPSHSVMMLRDFVFSRPCCPKNFSIYIGYPRKLMYNSESTNKQDSAATTIANFCNGKAEVVLIVDNDA